MQVRCALTSSFSTCGIAGRGEGAQQGLHVARLAVSMQRQALLGGQADLPHTPCLFNTRKHWMPSIELLLLLLAMLECAAHCLHRCWAPTQLNVLLLCWVPAGAADVQECCAPDESGDSYSTVCRRILSLSPTARVNRQHTPQHAARCLDDVGAKPHAGVCCVTHRSRLQSCCCLQKGWACRQQGER